MENRHPTTHALTCLTQRGKLPALPGDSPRFDLYDGLREFLISAKRKEIHNERVPEPESYEMGLQISRGIHTEAEKETNIWSTTSALGRNVPRAGVAQGIEDSGRAHDGRPRTHVHQHSTEVRGIECSGIFERKECDPDCTEVLRATEKLHGRALLGKRVFRFNGRAG